MNFSRWAFLSLLGFCLVFPLRIKTASAAEKFAVIVNADSKVNNLSFADLRKIYLGDRQFWSAGEKIFLLAPMKGSKEFKFLLKRIYRKSSSQYRQHWISKVFRAEASSQPRNVNAKTAGSLLKAIPTSIYLVGADKIPQGTKVLKIDGYLPEDSKYPLK